VAHSCNLRTQKVEIRRTAIQGKPMEKVKEISSQQIICRWWHAPVTPVMQEVKTGGLQSEAGLR
jgi:hypothetical protein